MNVVSLTPAAAARVREFQRQAPSRYVRVAVAKMDDSTGYRYDMGLVNDLDADKDYLGESQGVQIVVDHSSMLYLKGASIDWRTNADSAGFIFDNPNAVQK